MTTLNTTLAAAISAAMGATPTKINYSNTIGSNLGNTRRLRAFRDANASAPNPAATGVEFLNIGSSGALTIVGGNIVGFGILSGATVYQAADLSTGASALVLEGNGKSITWTLGLAGSGKEYTLPSSPTGSPNVGFAFAPGAGLKAPILLDSGTGPLSPALTANAPYTVDIDNWTTNAAVLAGTLTFDTRLQNLVMDHPQVAENMGDVKVYYSSNIVTMGQFEFGALLFVTTPSVNSSSTTEPSYQVVTGWKPTSANWPNYPFFDGYIVGTTDTFCPPFKARIKTQAGTLLYTHQMRDGLPISDPSLKDNDLANNPVRPHMNCFQMLPWSSVRHKNTSYLPMWMPGVKSEALRPTATRSHYSTNQALPLITFGINCNAIGHWFAMPKWPFAGNATAHALDTASQDPKLFPFGAGLPFPINPLPQLMSTGSFRCTGWGYEPAALGPIDSSTGTGGTRSDRYTMPATVAIAFTDMNYVRPRNNDPIVDIMDAHALHYFNLSHHHVTNASTMATLSIEDALNGVIGHGKTYYAPNDSYVTGGKAKTVPLFALPASATYVSGQPFGGAFVDKNGRMPRNGNANDYLHNYGTPFWYALFKSSPMHVYAMKHRLIDALMTYLGDDGSSDPSGGGGGESAWFLTRFHAWRYEHLLTAWVLSSDHPIIGIPRAPVMARWVRELEAVYNYVYKPIMIDNAQAPFYNAMRNTGTHLRRTSGQSTYSHPTPGQGYYLADVLQLMKQTGLWSVLRAQSDKCRLALDFMVRCLDLGSVDFILDTNGRIEQPSVIKGGTPSVPVVVDSWAEWNTLNPPRGSEDWITSYNGIKYGKAGSLRLDESGAGEREQDVTQHLRYQWLCFRRDVIKHSEVPCARGANGITQAIAVYKGFYDTVSADVAAGGPDWHFLWVSACERNAPSVLGPA